MEVVLQVIGRRKKKIKQIHKESLNKYQYLKEWQKLKKKKHTNLVLPNESYKSTLKESVNSQNGYYLVVPSEIDFDYLFCNHSKQEKEDAKFIIAYVLKQQLYKWNSKLKKYGNNNLNYNPKNFKVALYSGILQELYPNRYRKVLNVLRKNKVLWRFDYDQEKKESFSYSLDHKYWDNEPKIVAVNTNLTTVSNTINKMQKREKTETDAFIRNKYNYTYKFYKAKNFKVEIQDFFEHLNTKKQNLGTQRTYWALVQAIRYVNGEIGYLSYNPKSDGRLHSIIPQTPRVLRPFIRYFDKKTYEWTKKLSEVDLKSSIPYFLGVIIDNLISNELNLLGLNNLVESVGAYNSNILRKSIDTIELQAYRSAVLDGSLYLMFEDLVIPKMSLKEKDKYCRNTLGIGNYLEEQGMNRSILKHMLLSMYFCETDYYKYRLMEDAFKCHFPTIFNFITIVKGKMGRSNFANMIFQLEGNTMFEFSKAFNRKQNGRLPLFLLHDCIVTLSGHETELKSFLKECFINKFGYSPGLSIKHWADYM